MTYASVGNAILAHLVSIPEFARVSELYDEVDCEPDTLAQIVSAAGDVAEDVLAPFNRTTDAKPPVLEDGRVRLSPEHHAAWAAFVEGGWTTLESASEFGGAGLPHAVHSMCEELFNRASPAFGMLATSMRCAGRLLHKYADDAIAAEWLPNLIDGTWGATICISEAGAGSDVPRLRTKAEPDGSGMWSISGEKMWISFGDHDLAERIGHMVLAKTSNAETGASGISLFLVPSTLDGQANGVAVRRIEEKMGLHGSPTCEVAFEGARGWLIGKEARGLAQLFTMIIGMRLSVGSQGAGIAGAATEIAWRYAAERRQGGPGDAPPVAIIEHGDVQRMLLATAARAEVARGLVLLASLASDLEARETDPAAREHAGLLLAWLLPITKNFNAEAAFICSSNAVQVLGGAGYTTEWAAEQYLRDARVLSIYEGTSGMQALDLTMRRALGDEGRSMAAFVKSARADVSAAGDTPAAGRLGKLLDLLEEARAGLTKQSAKTVAYPFLQIASYATTGWIALRLTRLSGTPLDDHLAALGEHWLRIALPMAQAEALQVAMGDDLVAEFAAVDPSQLG